MSRGTPLIPDGVPTGRFVSRSQTQAAGPATLTVIDLTAATAGAGHWTRQLAGAVFNSTSDSVQIDGYNVGTGGAPSITSEPAWYLQWEADYNDGSRHNVEFHLDYAHRTDGATTVAASSNGVNTNTFAGSGTLNVASTTNFPSAGTITVATGGTPASITYTGITGTAFTGCTTVSGGGVLATGGTVTPGLNITRPIMIQVNRDTGMIQQFTLQATSLSFNDWATGTQFASLSLAGGLNVFATTTNTDPAVAIGNPNGITIATRHSHFYLYDGGYTSGPSFQIDTLNATQTSVSLQGTTVMYFFQGRGVGINVQDNTAGLTVQTGGNTQIGLKVIGRSGQTGDLSNVQDSTNANKWRVNKNGVTVIKPGTTAPVLADLADGEIAYTTDASGNLIITSRVSGALKTATVTVA